MVISGASTCDSMAILTVYACRQVAPTSNASGIIADACPTMATEVQCDNFPVTKRLDFDGGNYMRTDAIKFRQRRMAAQWATYRLSPALRFVEMIQPTGGGAATMNRVLAWY